MKKVFALLVAVMLVFTGALAVAEEDGSLAAIQEKGTLVLGLDDSFPPMGFRDEENNIVGYDIDLAQAVCEKLGVELVLQPIDWAAKDLELSSGNIDCIWNGMSRTDEREESMALSMDYMNNAIVFMVKDAQYQTKEDLAGKVVAVQTGSFAEEVLEADAEYCATLAEILDYQDYLSAIMDMQNGNVDAIAIDLIVANYQIASLGDESLFTIDHLADDMYCIGFRKEDLALRDAVNQALTDLAKEGAIAEISQKWFGTDISIVPAE